MNKIILMGRLTRDPEVKYSQGANSMAIARFTLAVDRRFRREGEATADFINCVAFGKPAEFAEKYYRQGIRIAITGRIQTGSYTNRDGEKVYTTEVVVEEQEFAESKGNSSSTDNQGQSNAPAATNSGKRNSNSGNSRRQPAPAPAPSYPDYSDGFMNIPDGIDEELPFN